MLVFALHAAAFMSPRHMLSSFPCSAQAQCATLASAPTLPRAFTQRPAVTMVLPRGNKDPNFDPDNVDPEAFKKTASRTAVLYVYWTKTGGYLGATVSVSARSLSARERKK